MVIFWSSKNCEKDLIYHPAAAAAASTLITNSGSFTCKLPPPLLSFLVLDFFQGQFCNWLKQNWLVALFYFASFLFRWITYIRMLPALTVSTLTLVLKASNLFSADVFFNNWPTQPYLSEFLQWAVPDPPSRPSWFCHLPSFETQ